MRSYLEEIIAAAVYKTENTAVGICCTDHVTLYPQNLELTSPTSGGRSVDIVHLRPKTTEIVFVEMYTGMSDVTTICFSVGMYIGVSIFAEIQACMKTPIYAPL
jgi:hypothetical protein